MMKELIPALLVYIVPWTVETQFNNNQSMGNGEIKCFGSKNCFGAGIGVFNCWK